MDKPGFSLCLIAEGNESAFLEVILPQYQAALEKVNGELILAGAAHAVKLPQDVTVIDAQEGVAARRRGKLRNLAIGRSRGNLILTGDCTALLGPLDWTERLLEWAEPIGEGVPYLFGFRVVSPQGERLWDWVTVDRAHRITLIDYGEQSSGLAVGGGYFGMSRAAWESSGGFNDQGIGPGEEIDFSQRSVKERKIPLIFSDALYAVRLLEPSPIASLAASPLKKEQAS